MDDVIWRPTGDRVSQSASFIQGNANFFNNPSKVERETILDAREGSQLFHWAGSTCAYTIFNTRDGAKFADRRLRHAMHLATNYVANQTAFWGEGFFALGGVLNNAHAEGLSQEELLTMPGWREDKTEDLKTANDLLAAAGFPEGKGLSFEFMGNTVWEAYGYNFSIRQMDDWRSAFPEIDVEGRLSADPTAHIEALTNGGFDVSHLPSGLRRRRPQTSASTPRAPGTTSRATPTRSLMRWSQGPTPDSFPRRQARTSWRRSASCWRTSPS